MTNLERAAALEAEQDWLSILPSDTPSFIMNEQYAKFEKNLLDRMRGNKLHKFTRTTVKVLVIAAILLSLTIAVLAATVGKDFILTHFDGFASYEIIDAEKDAKFVKDFQLGYIPEGFIKTDEDVSDMGITYSFSKGEMWFDVSKSYLEGRRTYTEEKEIEEIEINGLTLLYSDSTTSNSLIWNNGYYFYDINGNISKDELINIALNSK